MGVLVGHAREQVPCSICGEDSFQPGPSGPMATQCSTCGITACHKVPVLIHPTNSRCGSEMETMLKEAGWNVYWSPPYEDLAWVRRSWIVRVGEMLGRVNKGGG